MLLPKYANGMSAKQRMSGIRAIEITRILSHGAHSRLSNKNNGRQNGKQNSMVRMVITIAQPRGLSIWLRSAIVVPKKASREMVSSLMKISKDMDNVNFKFVAFIILGHLCFRRHLRQDIQVKTVCGTFACRLAPRHFWPMVWRGRHHYDLCAG